MISVITCSIKPDICQKMLDSINGTIGTEYETIVFDNREKKYGISKAYNEAAKEANGDYLCFVHEDIIIKTHAWGKELVKFAEQDNNCGVIGVAGGKSVIRNSYGWWSSPKCIARIQDGIGTNKRNLCINSDNEIFSRIICLDGVFLFVKKNIWENNKFDEETFKDFHFYDADFTFSISQKYRNYVYLGMDIHHLSAGNKERTFCENMFLFQKKHKKKLPCYLSGDTVSFIEKIKGRYIGIIRNYRLYRKNGFSLLQSLFRILYINTPLS